MSEHATLPLAAEFPPVTEADWIAAVRKVVLKGKPATSDPRSDDEFAAAFTRQLVSRTPDGITIEPLYTSDDAPPAAPAPGQAPYTRGARTVPAPWEVRQRVWPGVDGSSARSELESGATGVLVELPARADADALAEALAGVHLEMAPVSIATPGGDDGVAAAHLLIEHWEGAGTPLADRAGTLGADPIGAWARAGGANDLDAGLARLGELATRVADHPAAVRAYVADGTVWHEAGATTAQELAWNIAAAVATLRSLAERGIPLADAAARTEFRWAADADQFITIAKLRAARQLWARVAELAGLAPEQAAAFHHVESSRAMLTRYDTWTNALRATLACFGAGVGGADAVTVWPHDSMVIPGGSPHGRRIARNTQTILQSESHVWRVLDLAGGSWYVESLTAELASAAWAEVQNLDGLGGLIAAIEDGHLHQALDTVLAERSALIATRRQPLTGLSEFPDIDEPAPPPLPATPTAPVGETAFPPFTLHRLSEGFEAQRARADAHAVRTGARPTLFLARLGTLAQSTARTTFAKNLFETAGIRTVTSGVDEFAGGVVCLCASDPVYAEQGTTAAATLRQAGATRIYVAGRNVDVPDTDEEVGIGSDALDVLARALDALGVAR
jgi:methylmalonyl-CoA mutase